MPGAAALALIATAAFAYVAEDVSKFQETGACAECELTGLTLSNVDFTDADLRRANLSFSHLTDTDFSGADLSEAELTWVNFGRADLSGADLSNADLSGAILRESNLQGADLSGANFSSADLFRATVDPDDLAEARLCDTRMPNGDFRTTDCVLNPQD